MTIEMILLIMLVHYLADFILQTDWQAKNKSKNWEALFDHVMVYSGVWFLAFFIISGSPALAVLFFLLTFSTHFLIDSVTSRVVAYYFYKKKNTHNAFVTIGFDQILHYTQLLLCFNWLLWT